MIARVTIETDDYLFVAERVVVTEPFISDDADYVWQDDRIKKVKHTLRMDNEILENEETGVVYTVTDKKRVGRNRRGYEYGG